MAGVDLIEKSTADRLAEAAQLLLDAARAAHSENPQFKPGTEYVSEPYALSVQALFFADVWNGAYGAQISLDSRRTMDRIRGLAYGMGIALAALPPAAQLPCTVALQDGLNQGLQLGQAARKGRQP